MNYTPDCSEACVLTLKPVPGATNWPRRLECPNHGYPGEHRSKFTVGAPELEKPNLYAEEVASPADVTEHADGRIESQY
jgi:hypothetical protein